MELPEHLKAEVEPLLSLMLPLNEQIAALNDTLEQVAQQDALVANLCTTPQVGPVTASGQPHLEAAVSKRLSRWAGERGLFSLAGCTTADA
jgi:hypothetical protein